MPPSRIAFLIFVAVSLVVIGVELRARWAYSDTVQELDQAWDAAQAKGVGIYRADVEKLLHGSPSRVYDETATHGDPPLARRFRVRPGDTLRSRRFPGNLQDAETREVAARRILYNR